MTELCENHGNDIETCEACLAEDMVGYSDRAWRDTAGFADQLSPEDHADDARYHDQAIVAEQRTEPG